MNITRRVGLRASQGFTLIELVIVIVIIGILAVAAIPQYANLADSAQDAATQSVASSLTSASVINYGVRSVNAANGSAVTNCSDMATLLEGGALPTGYTITAAAIANGDVDPACVLNGPRGTTANFTGYGIT